MKLEEKFDELEKILAELEKNESGLEDAFKLYNDGMLLIKECNDSIEKVEKELEILSGEEK